jgi:hypothetical protein
LFNESNKNEPETKGDEPESITDNPPNLTLGDEALTVMTLSFTLNCDAVVYVIDEEPKTVKSCVTVKEPVIN